MNQSTPASIVIALFCLTAATFGSDPAPWPAESHAEAVRLTQLDPDFDNNMSGASYNPETQTFWVCRNGKPSAFWALAQNAEGRWAVKAKYDVGLGDLEGICQVDYNEAAVYLLDEGDDRIKAYDVSRPGNAKLLIEWDISAYMPTKGRAGSEGIAFVPDAWLEKERFRNAAGEPCSSRNGLGGLMLVAHQKGGRIYAFDLGSSDGTVHFVGAYKTARDGSAGLEFDRSTGLLYIWHNTGPNYLEIVRLSSDVAEGERRFTRVAEYIGPRKGNIEGIAIAPSGGNPQPCLLTDDNNKDGEALILFTRFNPAIAPPPGR